MCDLARHVCACSPGWTGSDCDIVVRPDCADGVTDVDGACCVGYIDVVTGRCCPDNAGVDSYGRCCGSGVQVDACGVCGGSGVAVDVLGVCCPSPLAPSGLCCGEAALDSCGVCGGNNSCGYVFVFFFMFLCGGWGWGKGAGAGATNKMDSPRVLGE